MKSALYFGIFAALGSAGCVPAAAPTPTVYPCTEAGTVERVSVDSATEVSLYLPPCAGSQTEAEFPVLYLFPGYGGSNDSF
jgi:hypothetical protein